jgi:hypothetical protein
MRTDAERKADGMERLDSNPSIHVADIEVWVDGTGSAPGRHQA